MSNTYISLYQVLGDANSYVKIQSGQPLTLANIQALAQARWTWIVNNWLTLSPSFKTVANGNQDLESKYEDFQRFVESYNLGNKNNPFDTTANFLDVIAFLNLIGLNVLRLSPEEASVRDQEIDRINKLDIEDFRAMMTFLEVFAAQLAQEVGLGDADAAKLLGIQVAKKQRNATIDDLDSINQVNQLHAFVETLLIRAQQSQKRPPDILSLTNQLVNPNSKITFDDSWVSYTPVPFEISLEHMAQRYLGSKAQWFELVTINNLQPPYIDAVGEKFPLLTPGAVNNVIIADTSKQNVPVGTKVSIGSYKVREESRIVKRVILNENSTMVLFLSGNADLSRFKSQEGGFVRIYAPQTTKPGNFVLIPSHTASGVSGSVPTPTTDSLRRLDKALLAFGVDIARTDDGDIIMDPNGNFKYAAGLVNVKQTVLNALKTVRGELPFHPNFGVNTNIGERFFGTTDEALIFGELLRDTLLNDPRLDNVQIERIATTGTGIALQLLVTVVGSNQPLPLAFIS